LRDRAHCTPLDMNRQPRRAAPARHSRQSPSGQLTVRPAAARARSRPACRERRNADHLPDPPPDLCLHAVHRHIRRAVLAATDALATHRRESAPHADRRQAHRSRDLAAQDCHRRRTRRRRPGTICLTYETYEPLATPRAGDEQETSDRGLRTPPSSVAPVRCCDETATTRVNASDLCADNRGSDNLNAPASTYAKCTTSPCPLALDSMDPDAKRLGNLLPHRYSRKRQSPRPPAQPRARVGQRDVWPRPRQRTTSPKKPRRNSITRY
jgi:hypothetical protein